MKEGAVPLLAEAASVLSGQAPAEAPKTPLHVGVDLGTATMVLLVLDKDRRPIDGRWRPAQVVRDGLVVDFIGAVDQLKAMKSEIETDLDQTLVSAFSAYPPGIPEAERRAIAHVVESAGMECLVLVDEPSAANQVLGLADGAIVDIGGGTTGIAILQDGEVVYTADEATGGTHFNLVIAGALDLEYEQAERLKETPEEHDRLRGVVRPVIEKIGSIINRHVEGWQVPSITLVGGASAFRGIDGIIQETTNKPTTVAPHTQWVTPLGIALSKAHSNRGAKLPSLVNRSIS
ncbi:MAG: ethanolamine utilization protein EutJ [Anaerolineales bacterium]